MSEAGTLDQGAIANLRHELRTPLNHIIGYSDMILEDDAGEFAPCLQAIRATARELVGSIQQTLSPDLQSLPPERFQQLRESFDAPIRRVLTEIERLQPARNDQFAADTEKILQAATVLLEFTQGKELVTTASAVQHPPVAVPEHTGAARLLVVDDNAANREMLLRHLQRQGYQVETVADGREALAQLREGRFDLLLLDIMMPGIDGFEVLRIMKDDEALRSLPVIMISALDETQSVIRCIEMGAEDYLSKPFDPVLLRARLSASLEKKRLRDEERERTAELQRTLDELRRTQDQLVLHEKLASLGALTAGIAHEIKNPLNFITNFADLSVDLLEELRAELGVHAEPAQDVFADLTGNLEKIREHGRRADKIVRGMLMHSRGGSGELQTVDLNALVAEATNLAYHGLRARDMTFQAQVETQLDPAVGVWTVIPQDLSRVVLNLVNNACYAVHEKQGTAGPQYQPCVVVRTRRQGDRVEISIRDNGPGIPPEVRQKLFQPFFTTKPAGSGTGLGLSLSYDIVTRGHGGELRLESDPGEFAEFIISLPAGGKAHAA